MSPTVNSVRRAIVLGVTTIVGFPLAALPAQASIGGDYLVEEFGANHHLEGSQDFAVVDSDGCHALPTFSDETEVDVTNLTDGYVTVYTSSDCDGSGEGFHTQSTWTAGKGERLVINVSNEFGDPATIHWHG